MDTYSHILFPFFFIFIIINKGMITLKEFLKQTSYLKQVNTLTLSKTRARVNSKDPKKRVYGVSEQEEVGDLEGLQDINSDDIESLQGDANAETGEELDPDEQIDVEAESESEDPDKQGVIRIVKGARLVYKRQTEDGDFEELWIFNVGDAIKDSLKKQKAILAGTDIPPKKTKSEDRMQHYTLTTLGNAQLLNIRGLPN